MTFFGGGFHAIAQQALTVANEGLTKIDQHMHDCELRAGQVQKRMDDQDRNTNEKHYENTKRFDALSDRIGKAEASARNRYLVIVTGMFIAAVGGMGGLIVELGKLMK